MRGSGSTTLDVEVVSVVCCFGQGTRLPERAQSGVSSASASEEEERIQSSM